MKIKDDGKMRDVVLMMCAFLMIMLAAFISVEYPMVAFGLIGLMICYRPLKILTVLLINVVGRLADRLREMGK